MSAEYRLSHPFTAVDSKEFLTGPARVIGIGYHPCKSTSPHYLESCYLDWTGIHSSETDGIGDRQLMICQTNGKMETQRSTPSLARVRFSTQGESVLIEIDGDRKTFSPSQERKMEVTVQTTTNIPVFDQGDAVAEWLSERLGKNVRLVLQDQGNPRRRSDAIPALADVQTVLRLQDSSPLTCISHTSLNVLNQALGRYNWQMGADSFRMNLLFAGEINEHSMVGKYIKFGSRPDAAIVYVWRPKERCPMPAVDQSTGDIRGNTGSPKDKMSYIYQEELKALHGALSIPQAWREKPSRNGHDVVAKAMLGVDVFPVVRGQIRVGDPIITLDSLPS